MAQFSVEIIYLPGSLMGGNQQQLCLRHYNAPNETLMPGRFMLWWRSSGLATKVATVIAGVIVVVFFL